jgi:hypothetical protein
MFRSANTRFPTLLPLLALLVIVSGCGSSKNPSLNGTWTFAAVSSVLLTEPPQTISGTLTSQGSNVTATLTFSNACFKGQALAYTGSISDGNSLKLNSVAYANQVVALTGNLSQDGTLLTAGTYTVSASNISQAICDTGDTGSLTGSRLSATP